MYVRVDGDREKSERLSAAIKERMADVKVENTRKEKTVYILDVDAITTEEEVRSAVIQNLKCSDKNGGDVKIRSLHLNRAGSKTAVVVAPMDMATKLLDLGRIRIGWLSCRIRGGTEVLRCYRCLESGHEAAKCKGIDRSKCCLRCGEEGHKVFECKNEEKCAKCDKEGHRIDSRRCPAFAALMKSVGVSNGARETAEDD